MIKIYKHPTEEEQNILIQRPAQQINNLSDIVESIFNQVKQKGDEALREYTLKFDGVSLDTLRIPSKNIETDFCDISEKLKSAIQLAYQNIKAFHQSQQHSFPVVEATKGVKCWMEYRPIEKVGIYVPGGTAPLFSTVLMLAVPALLAGCKEIVLCTPPNKSGKIHPVIDYTANLLGIKNVFTVGGIQAIAALTYGTETIPKTDKIFGPGNSYVTAAKQYAMQCGVAIDMPAGPSEVLVIADKSAHPNFIASDLLSQAEHGADSQVVLLTDNQEILEKTLIELEKQVKKLPRRELAEKSLKNSSLVLLENIEKCIELSNQYAPEHLIVALEDAEKHTNKITHAGSVFLGHYSCESLGDYASGTNHTLPTYGYARNYSGVSLSSFMKTITFQKITKEGIKKIGNAVEIMAEAEQLEAHKNAVTKRLKFLENEK